MVRYNQRTLNEQTTYVIHTAGTSMNLTFSQPGDAYITAISHTVSRPSSFSRQTAWQLTGVPNLSTFVNKLQLPANFYYSIAGTDREFPPSQQPKVVHTASFERMGATAKERPSLAWSSPPYKWGRCSARGLVTRRPS